MPDIEVHLPAEVENLHLPSPDLVTYYRNLENRVLWLDSDVDEYWLEFARKIIEWNRDDKEISSENRKPIKLMLFSAGGDIDVNDTLIDVIQLSKTPVWGINTGQACSSACYINIACHKRLALPKATYLLHQGSGGFQGTYDQVVAAVIEYQRKIEDLESYLLANTKIPKDVLEDHITTDWYLNSATALEYGVCDEIVSDIDQIL